MTSARWTIADANTGTFDLSGSLPHRQAGDHDRAGIFRAAGGKFAEAWYQADIPGMPHQLGSSRYRTPCG